MQALCASTASRRLLHHAWTHGCTIMPLTGNAQNTPHPLQASPAQCMTPQEQPAAGRPVGYETDPSSMRAKCRSKLCSPSCSHGLHEVIACSAVVVIAFVAVLHILILLGFCCWACGTHTPCSRMRHRAMTALDRNRRLFRGCLAHVGSASEGNTPQPALCRSLLPATHMLARTRATG